MTHTTYNYSLTMSHVAASVAALVMSSLINRRQVILLTVELYLDDAIEAKVDDD